MGGSFVKEIVLILECLLLEISIHIDTGINMLSVSVHGSIMYYVMFVYPQVPLSVVTHSWCCSTCSVATL